MLRHPWYQLLLLVLSLTITASSAHDRLEIIELDSDEGYPTEEVYLNQGDQR